jgi:hypothetical protein
VIGRLGIVVAAATLLAASYACGGGGNGDPAPVTDYPYPIQMFPELARDHFAVGQVYDQYNSNPPTSGPHASSPVQWGIYEEPVPKEMAVHNMEHAGAIVWYNCSGGPSPLSDDACATLKNDLAAIVQPAVASGEMLVMTPYPGMDTRIAMTGWQYLDAFDEFDAQRVQMFLDTFECRFDPEGFC